MSEPLTEEKPDPPVPWQLEEWELTEAEMDALYRVAKDPNSKVGRLTRIPRRVPLRTPKETP